MKLLRLEMKGFKSFARETVIHFNERITGVVGPNGSGKSNVVDAIRWVLGEQKSSELRLEKMGDILFNGTQKRKPAPVARVSVTFENDKGLINSEYSELSVTRILYRSGESEYRLNDVSCRLKDIRSVLLDTGIGSNSYAIIALGMVDDILSDKDQARRKMFEQAAGISKYKSRKRETLNKLKLTKADLDRVEDLLHELENTLKQQKKQARRAEKYLNLKDKYKSYSIDLAILNSSRARSDFKSIKEELGQVQSAFDEITAQINTKEAEVESKKQINLEKESSVSQNQRDLSAIVRETQSLENKRDITRQSISYGQQAIKRLENQISDKTQKLKEYTSTITRLESEILAENAILKERQDALEKLKTQKTESQKSYQEIKSGRSDRLQKLQVLQQQEYDWKQKIAVLESRVETIQSQMKRFDEQLESQSQRKSELKAEWDRQNELLIQLEHNLNQLQKNEAERKEMLVSLEEQKEEKTKEAQELERKYDALQNEFKLLKNLVEKLEGFPESTKFLMRSKKWNKPAALFSDVLISPAEYRAALENYLENYLSHFIVNQAQDALEGIKLLKESQKGKAHFLLNNISENSSQTQDIPQAKPALQVVETDSAYAGLIGQLLHEVYLVENEDLGYSLSQQYPDYTFLVKDGSASFHKSLMSGGSSGLFEGKRLGRKKNLKKIEREIHSISQDLQNRHQTIQSLTHEIHGLKKEQQEEEMRALQAKLADAKSATQKTSLQLSNLDEAAGELQSQKQNLATEKSEIHKQIIHIQEQWEGLKKEKFELEKKVEQVDSIYEQHAQTFSELSQKYNEAHIKLIQQENRCSQLEKDLQYQKSRKTELSDLLEQHKTEIEEQTEEQKKHKQTEIETKNRLAQLYRDKEHKSEALNAAERIYFEARNMISGLEKEVKQLLQQQRQKQELIQSLKERHTESKMVLHGISERLKVEFDISINQIIDQSPDFEGTREELDHELTKIKGKLQNFGDVNPMAVEAFKETQERYDLMLNQRNDILDAQDKLETTIKEIEKQATEQFMEAFEKIRTNFIDVFRTLFTEGDDADLILSDPEDPLESLVEIVAKPKGKRPKSLSQLSGGEKTLTATALLFALYLLKPAPFCVFDEVDAPLDDANIEKFNRIIKRFAEQSQFIIVTHNKSTMAAVDIIYGVYMNEPGVSGLSPVDFRKLEHKSVTDTLSTAN